MSQVVSFEDYTPAARFDSIPWSAVKVEEGTTSSGPWTLIDTITLSPPDSDPANPQARNITTDNASDTSDLWYRLTFTDANGGVGQPSEPVQNTAPDTPFASVDDFQTRIRKTLTAEERTWAEALLAEASAVLADEVGQQIALATETITIPGTTNERILLPQRPVVSVASVLLNGTALGEGTDWFLEENELVRIPSSLTLGVGGLVDSEFAFPLGTGFGWEEQTLTITYTHGYAEIPGKVKAICLEMAVRVWVNPGSVAREAIGDTNTVYDNMRFSPGGLLPTDDERKQLKRLFGRKVTSITVEA